MVELMENSRISPRLKRQSFSFTLQEESQERRNSTTSTLEDGQSTSFEQSRREFLPRKLSAGIYRSTIDLFFIKEK